MKTKTFAQRALDIQKKYSRAKFDATEKAEMEAALDALIDEQEAYKASKGYGEETPGVQKFDGTGPSRLSHALMGYDPNLAMPDLANPEALKTIPMLKAKLPTTPLDTKTLAKPVSPTKGKEDKTSILPTAIGAGAGLIGNLFLANKAKGLYNPVDAPMTSASTINLAPQVEGLKKDAGISKRINLLNARNTGASAGEMLANTAAANAGVDKVLGDSLTKLYLGQEQFNASANNEVNMFNAQSKARANMFNSQSKTAADSESLDYLSGAIQTLPAAMREVQLMKADEKNKRLLENYYKTIGGTHYQMLNSLYGSNPFQFQVK